MRWPRSSDLQHRSATQWERVRIGSHGDLTYKPPTAHGMHRVPTWWERVLPVRNQVPTCWKRDSYFETRMLKYWVHVQTRPNVVLVGT